MKACISIYIEKLCEIDIYSTGAEIKSEITRKRFFEKKHSCGSYF